MGEIVDSQNEFCGLNMLSIIVFGGALKRVLAWKNVQT